jgi:hypothetical protein
MTGNQKLYLLVAGVAGGAWFVWKKFGALPAIALLIGAWLKFGWTGD